MVGHCLHEESSDVEKDDDTDLHVFPNPHLSSTGTPRERWLDSDVSRYRSCSPVKFILLCPSYSLRMHVVFLHIWLNDFAGGHMVKACMEFRSTKTSKVKRKGGRCSRARIFHSAGLKLMDMCMVIRSVGSVCVRMPIGMGTGAVHVVSVGYSNCKLSTSYVDVAKAFRYEC